MSQKTVFPDLDEGILCALRRPSGQYFSEGYLSAQLDVPCSLLAEGVRRLRYQGYDIEAHPHLGYRLISVPDLLLAQEIRYGLRTTLMGRSLFCYHHVQSTNQVAAQMAQGGAQEGTLVLAEEQLAGKGRLGRVWYSPPLLGLWLSIILRPHIPPDRMFQLAICGALAVAEAIYRKTHLRVRVKWPNDVYINGRKVAGVLTETQLVGDSAPFVILGMGVNVNHGVDDFPSSLQEKATSLNIELGRKVLRAELLCDLLWSFEKIYFQFQTHGLEPFLGRWRQLSCVIGRMVSVQVGERVFAGTAIDLDRQGALIFEEDGGQRRCLLAGDVSLVDVSHKDIDMRDASCQT